ncbi:MAG: hypothetical protein E6J79_19200, partial [Deltaproteobacteria bacterium]
AAVQARRLRRINPELAVIAIADTLENVPMGRLRGLLLGCVDSRVARRTLNWLAWRLGVPWIDAGVHGEELLARINVHMPGPAQPCLECAWEARDYETLEQAYPCAGNVTPPATNAPSALGALAAALQALECRKLLEGDRERLAIGKQVTVSARTHRHYVTRFAVNPACRFDHETWRIEVLARGPEHVTVREAFELGRGVETGGEPLRLGVPHQTFASALCCLACGDRRGFSLYLLGRLDVAEQRCARCGGRMRAAGADLFEWLPEADLPPAMKSVPLRSLGFRRGDVFTVAGAAGAPHFQIGATA